MNTTFRFWTCDVILKFKVVLLINNSMSHYVAPEISKR